MRNFLLITLLLHSISSWAQPGVAPERDVDGKRYYIHNVEPGNTLWGLQQMYGVKVEEIMAANPTLSSGLKAGESILIPIQGLGQQSSQTQEILTSKYKVKKGETLYGISRKFNTSVDNLISLNPILSESTLQKGQIIIVPGEGDGEEVVETNVTDNNTHSDPVPNPFVADTVKSENGESHEVRVVFNDSIVNHKVLQHETMYSISKRFMVSIETIMKENNLSSTTLSTGQILKIPVRQERIEKLVIKPVPPAYDPNGTDPIDFEVKDRYKIAVIVPFFLEHGKGYSEYISDVATQFYMGSTLAIDTLKELGLNADIQYYDSKRDSATVMKILNTPGFENTDLVIGPFFPITQKLVSEYCKENAIRMVTPVSSETSLLEGNRLVYSAVPSSITLMEQLADYIAENHSSDRIIFVKPVKEEDMPLYEAFRDAYNRAESSGSKAALNETTVQGMKNFMTKSSDNVFIYPCENRHYAEKFFNEVSVSNFRAKKDGIIIYGTKKWVDFTGVHNSYKNDLNMRFSSPNFVDYYTDKMINMNKAYRALYKTDFSKMAIQGYDVMLYSCSHFLMNDTPVNLLMNDFNFVQIDEGDGYENKHIYVIEQEDYELINVDLRRDE